MKAKQESLNIKFETNIILMPNWGKFREGDWGEKGKTKRNEEWEKKRNRKNWGAHWLTGMNSKKNRKDKKENRKQWGDES